MALVGRLARLFILVPTVFLGVSLCFGALTISLLAVLKFTNQPAAWLTASVGMLLALAAVIHQLWPGYRPSDRSLIMTVVGMAISAAAIGLTLISFRNNSTLVNYSAAAFTCNIVVGWLLTMILDD